MYGLTDSGSIAGDGEGPLLNHTIDLYCNVMFVDSGIAGDGEGVLLNHTLDLTAEADNTPLVEPRLKMITHKQVGT